MPKRRVWTDEEDRILLRLKDEMGEKKWTCIANIMKKKFGLIGRSGKQCRERYSIKYAGTSTTSTILSSIANGLTKRKKYSTNYTAIWETSGVSSVDICPEGTFPPIQI